MSKLSKCSLKEYSYNSHKINRYLEGRKEIQLNKNKLRKLCLTL